MHPAAAICFFVGLILTCVWTASYYHLEPYTHRSAPSPTVSAWQWCSRAFWVSQPANASARAPVNAVVVLVAVRGVLAAWVARANLTPWVVVHLGGLALAVDWRWHGRCLVRSACHWAAMLCLLCSRPSLSSWVM